MTNITTISFALSPPTGHSFKIKNNISLIWHALVDFNVFVTPIFITPTNFHQFMCLKQLLN